MKTGGNGVVYAEMNTRAMNDITKDYVLLSKIHSGSYINMEGHVDI